MPDKAAILEKLRGVLDPEIGISIVDLNMVRDIGVNEDGIVQVRIALTVQHCPMAKTLQADVEKAVGKLDGVKSVNVETTAMSKKELEELRVKLTARGTNSQTSQSGQNTSTAGPGINKLGKRGIRNIIAIVSGKGGVGKSFVTSMFATGYLGQSSDGFPVAARGWCHSGLFASGSCGYDSREGGEYGQEDGGADNGFGREYELLPMPQL